MSIIRIPIETVADPKHGRVLLEGSGSDKLPADRVYVEPTTGYIIDGRKGDSLQDLGGGEIEIPRTTWY